MSSLFACSNSGNAEDKTENKSAATPAGATIQLTKSMFLTDVFDFEKNQEWKYQGDVPCIIDFYADWCRPCKMVAPIMDELAAKYEGKIKIYKVNTDKEQELARAFNISSIPAILYVPMTGQPQMNVGAMSKADYEKVINDFLLTSTIQ
jgi:thioredoxin